VTAVTAQYYVDPIGFGTALRDACRNLCKVKMHTKAFLEPYEYDDSLEGALIKPEEWNFESPYTLSFLEFIANNVLNTIVHFVKNIL
jgi:hypothetical protein